VVPPLAFWCKLAFKSQKKIQWCVCWALWVLL
jgi:hypothetical protein